ncbi:DNA/RNA non-specific endonuclease [Bordetella sp. 02P26C-1]|uniref:DNA/RNA non-specific endonuclease n=1 Tax=Bordetella sp. 02P26C-1 TaxID=2683195 RepID=UPI001352F0B5|nr:DNA/RNA non-specific endonuclease [Bordetella sp. 02P26C-1]MVW80124.1 DNA/RNA non-specific endonuclease [Bordetella sp. 02P26C-1]
MASKKKSTSSKKRSSSSSKAASSSRFAKFLGTFFVFVATGFGIGTYGLNPQWRMPDMASLPVWAQDVAQRLQGLLPSFSGVDGYAPSVHATGETVQTQFFACPQFFPGQAPVVPATQKLRELCFSGFAVLHSGQTKTPVFVAERLNRQLLAQGQGLQRTDKFYADARLPATERAELADYKGSGYSRGHMAPAADMYNADAMAQSFSLANMVPQDQTHNAGPWSKIEQDTRKFVERATGDVYIFTGPVYDERPKTIGSGVAVPSHLFKLVYDEATGRAWVHWQANRAETKVGAPISYEEFVKRTGLRLLPAAR